MKRLTRTSLWMQTVCALLLTSAPLSVAGQTNNSGGTDFIQPVPESISLYKSHEWLRQDGSIRLAVAVSLLPRNGKEIFFNSNSTGSNPGLSPMLLVLDPQPGFEITPVSYPRAHVKEAAFSANSVAIFDGNVPMRFSIRALPNAPLGKHIFSGRLTTQALDNQRVYKPQNTPLIFTIEVVGPRVKSVGHTTLSFHQCLLREKRR